MSKPRNLVAAFALGLLPACSISFGDWGGPDVWIEETESFTVSAASLESLSCQTHNGRITATGQTGSDMVQVTVRKKAGGDDLEDAEDAMDAIRIISESENGELKLGWEWRQGRDRDWRAAVSFDIEQPTRLSVTAKTHNGRITLEHVGGACRAETHNGKIEVSASGDQVNLETHNGAIVASLGATQSIGGSITTHNGSVRVKLADAVSAMIRCSTHNGGISSDLRLVDSFKGRNFLTGELGQGGEKLEIRTHNGSIRLH